MHKYYTSTVRENKLMLMSDLISDQCQQRTVLPCRVQYEALLVCHSKAPLTSRALAGLQVSMAQQEAARCTYAIGALLKRSQLRREMFGKRTSTRIFRQVCILHTSYVYDITQCAM